MKKTAKEISDEIRALVNSVGLKKELRGKFMDLTQDILKLEEKPAAEPKKKTSK